MVITIIPAKEHSKGVPGKNLRALQGRPLLTYVLETAQQTHCIDEVWVCTESAAIAEVAQAQGAQVIFQPPELSEEPNSAVDSALYAAEWLPDPEIIVLLLATYPLLLSEDLDACVQLFSDRRPQSVCALTEVPPDTYHFAANLDSNGRIKWKQPLAGRRHGLNRQDLARQEQVYEAVGLWVIGRETFLNWQTVYTDDMLGYVVPPERAVDIDHEVDFVVAEYYLRLRAASRP